jgi:hypothetical protein
LDDEHPAAVRHEVGDGLPLAFAEVRGPGSDEGAQCLPGLVVQP